MNDFSLKLEVNISDIELLCVYIQILRVIIGSHNLLIPGCYICMPDEVFHDWKLIRIKERRRYASINSG
jgi:hypothetical protein